MHLAQKKIQKEKKYFAVVQVKPSSFYEIKYDVQEIHENP